jgi:Xaa-Pro aminopeptidase
MITVAEFSRRRRALMAMADSDSIFIIPSAKEKLRSKDSSFAFRQDSDFWYLTGFNEPDAVLVLVPGRQHGASLLFCRERDANKEIWDGPRLGPEGVVDGLRLDDAYPITDLDDILPGLLEGRSRVHYHFGREPDFDLKLMGWLNRVRAQKRLGAEPPHELLELGHVLDELRLFKSKAEIALLRCSAEIGAQAQIAAMRATLSARYEYEVEAALQYVYRRNNAVASYEPIVGSGANACVLHYRANNARIKKGDLLLCDAGAEYDFYASDITRTWPSTGRFSKAQRELYTLVLAAQRASIDAATLGAPYDVIHNAAVAVLCDGLLSLGLLKGTLKKAIESEAYKKFYMHKTGHWLGLDVHDVGEYKLAGASRQLEVGMVFTIEPGLYILPDTPGVPEKYQGIGIRIEDDIVMTQSGAETISASVPKDVDAIEALMADAS